VADKEKKALDPEASFDLFEPYQGPKKVDDPRLAIAATTPNALATRAEPILIVDIPLPSSGPGRSKKRKNDDGTASDAVRICKTWITSSVRFLPSFL
jgi:hypothetical protein